jgi:hypothetical protein
MFSLASKSAFSAAGAFTFWYVDPDNTGCGKEVIVSEEAEGIVARLLWYRR